MSLKPLSASVVFMLLSTVAVVNAQKAGPDPAGPRDVTEVRPATPRQQQLQPAKPAKGPASESSITESGWHNPDYAMASCIAGMNQVEIALSEFVMGKTKNESVKKFAGMLVEDHRALVQQLKSFAPEATQGGFLMPDNREVRTDVGAQPSNLLATTTAQPVASEPNAANVTGGTRAPVRIADPRANAPAFSHQQLARELAQQSLNSSRKRLEVAPADEFDASFLGLQIAMHMHLLDQLVVYQRHSSKELGQVLAAGQKKTEQHLAKAEELMKGLAPSDKAKSTEKNPASQPASKEGAAK
jgi:predicted outer membrane protein